MAAIIALIILAMSFSAYSQNCKPKTVLFPKDSNIVTINGTTKPCNEHLIKVSKNQRLQIKLNSPEKEVYFALIQADATEEERGGDWFCEDCKTMNAYFDDDIDWEINVYEIDDKSVKYTMTLTLTDSKIIEGGILNGKALSLPKPTISKEAREAGAKGTVNVKIEIGEDGEVYQAEAVSGNDLLRWTAEESAMMARFKPTFVNGKRVRVSGTLVYNFK